MNFGKTSKEVLVWCKQLWATLSSSRHLINLLLLSLTLSLVVGIGLFVIDPAIRSPLDGVWSAWVTMTHVGFGDVVPVSFIGRLLSSVLILFGLILLSTFTAVLSVALIGKSTDGLWQTPRHGDDQAATALSGEEQILQELRRLNERMAELEKRLPN